MLDIRNFVFHKALSFGRFIVYHILGVCVYGSIPVIVSMGHLNPYLPYLATSLHKRHLVGLGVSISDRFKKSKTLKNAMYNYSIMTVADWAGLVLTALSIVAITVGGISTAV